MKVLNLLHHKEIAKELKFIESGKEVDVSKFPLDKNTTVIVGANNSRKSRFLRSMLKQKSYFIVEKNTFKYIDELRKLLDKIPKGETFLSFKVEPYSNDLVKTYGESMNEISWNTFSNLINEFKNLKDDEKIEKIENIKTIINLMSKATYLGYQTLDGETSNKFDVSIKETRLYHHTIPQFLQYKDLLKKLNTILEKLSDTTLDLATPKRTYIPTLRGTIQLIQKAQDEEKPVSNKCFANTTAKNYGLEEDKIFTGLDLYKRIKSARNSKRTIREGFEKFEEFLSNNFFGDKTIDIIALEDEPGQIQVYIEGDSDRKIYDLGDGIQSLIILLYPIFNASEGEWIFIEEPELNMHPGLQSLFLNTITTNKFIKEKKLQFFITSHSNHFLNCLIEQEDLVNIFSFEQITGGKDGYSIIRQVSNSTTRVLNLIGVKNSSVFMSNCSIWVEGISDRKILKAMLRAYCEEKGYPIFIEGYHYAFFEYAGSNLVHYLFSEEDEKETEKIKAHFIANKIFLLADTDGKEDENKLNRHQELEKLSRDDFVYMQTGAVEIENILGASVIKKIIKDFWKDADLSKIEIDETEYEDVRLGKYLIKKLDGNMLKVPMLKEDSGTLKTYYKNKISEFVINSVEDDSLKWSDFATNENAVKIVEKLYDYIKSQN